MSDERNERLVSDEELEWLDGEPLPERTEMSLIRPMPPVDWVGLPIEPPEAM